MSFPKYFVTYCVMDGEAGANPFWHASLILSTQKSPTGPIRVVDAVGFYSQPSTTTNPLIKAGKQLLGFKVDLQDSHGVLIHEKMRDIDGNGLRGVSFVTSKEQFEQLKLSYTKKMALEQQAIRELNQHLSNRGEVANAYTRHITEKSLAALENREPRLKPFHITMSLTRRGFDSTASHACKNYALNLLLENKIINENLRDQLNGGATAHAFPRFSSKLKPIRLVSTGAPKMEVSQHSGRVFHNRTWENNRLYWATSLRLHHWNTNELSTPQDPYPFVRNMLTRIRTVEMQLRHKISEFDEPSKRTHLRKHRLEHQLQRVQKLYNEFSIAFQNQQPHCLAAKLLHAETTLNVATMTLTPNRVNYPFMMRLYESIAIRNSLLSLLCLALAATFLSTIAGAVVISAAGLAAGHQLYGFFKEEQLYARMNTDYLAFHQTKAQNPTVTKSDSKTDIEAHSPFALA